MNLAAARVTFTLAAALFAVAATAAFGNAQVVRGTVKAKESGALLDRAQIFAQNEKGLDIGMATTDEKGRFQLVIKSDNKPFTISVRRLGIAPTKSDNIKMPAGDTANIEFLVEETSTAPVDTFKVQSRQSLNDRALAEAERRGWRMLTPAEVETHRLKARTVQDLLRSWGNAGLNFGARPGDCVRSTRNNQCLDWVVDGQPAGPIVHMNPQDIYFLAVLGRTEAQAQWGSKTPNGAIVIYTRMYGDKIK